MAGLSLPHLTGGTIRSEGMASRLCLPLRSACPAKQEITSLGDQVKAPGLSRPSLAPLSLLSGGEEGSVVMVVPGGLVILRWAETSVLKGMLCVNTQESHRGGDRLFRS